MKNEKSEASKEQKKREREKARSSHVLIKIIGKNGLNLPA